jgi:LuxR family maltose regulon positive regulatory protein
MHERETARQAAGERPLYAQQGARGTGPGAEPHRWSEEPIPSGMNRYRSRGGLEVVPGGDRAAHAGSRLVERHSQETAAALAAVRDGSLPRTNLMWAAAFLLLEAIADDVADDPDVPALVRERDLGLVEPDRLLFPALIHVALGLLERRAGHGAAEASLVSELADLLGEAKWPVSPSAEPPWPGEPLTGSETRVLRYLPTHLGTREIAAELFISANTVRTHLRHLYRKLGAHSRQEAVQRARAIGLLAVSSRRP